MRLRLMDRPIFVLAIGLTLVQALRATPQTTGQSTAEACVEGRSDSDRAKEALAISKANGQVSREGCVLRIRTAGDDRKLTDEPDELRDTFVRYEYEGILPGTEFHVVVAQLYESRAFEFVGPKGGARLIGPPKLSTDRRRVLATSRDLTVRYVPNAVEIWNIERGYPTLELSLRSDEWGPDDAMWIDANTIQFSQSFLDETGVNEYTRKGARLRHTASGWSFEPAK
jgi:hypothetical protein